MVPLNGMEDLQTALKQQKFTGDIDVSPPTRELFSHDASMFELMPTVVIAPKTSKDIQAVVKYVASKTKDHQHGAHNGVQERKHPNLNLGACNALNRWPHRDASAFVFFQSVNGDGVKVWDLPADQNKEEQAGAKIKLASHGCITGNWWHGTRNSAYEGAIHRMTLSPAVDDYV